MPLFPLRRSRPAAAERLHDVLPDPEQFGRILRVELMRADRGRTGFCLAVFDLDRWLSPAAHGPAGGDHGPRAAAFARFLVERLRATDYAGHLGGGRVAVILWHTDEYGAARFVEKVGRGWHASKRPPVTVYAYPSEIRVGAGPKQIPVRRRDPGAAGGRDAAAEGSERAGADPPAAFGGGFRRGDLNGAPGEAWADLLDGTDAAPHGPARTPAGVSHAAAAATSIAGTDTVSSFEAAAEVETTPDMPALVDEPDPVGQIDTGEESTTRDDDDPPPPPQLVPVYALEELLLCPLPRWKRAVDVLGAGVGLLALAPLLGCLAAAVKVTSRGPALFQQTRDGLGGRRFTIYKFRTMVADAEARKAALRSQSEQDGPAFKMARDPRITPIGRWLRKTCLDELPQLWNVFRGDMSLVGPRPLDSRESDRTTWWERRRLLVTPGLTCIWQVHGKSRVTFDEWMRMDIRYMQRPGAVRDFGLIFRTAWNMARHRGSH